MDMDTAVMFSIDSTKLLHSFQNIVVPFATYRAGQVTGMCLVSCQPLTGSRLLVDSHPTMLVRDATESMPFVCRCIDVSYIFPCQVLKLVCPIHTDLISYRTRNMQYADMF